MHTNDYASPEQLDLLGATLEAYCREHGISEGSEAHEDAARILLDLFKSGVECADCLTKGLSEALQKPLKVA
jgi:hypothetical protein